MRLMIRIGWQHALERNSVRLHRLRVDLVLCSVNFRLMPPIFHAAFIEYAKDLAVRYQLALVRHLEEHERIEVVFRLARLPVQL